MGSYPLEPARRRVTNQRSIPLVKTLHDLSENDAKRFCRWFVVASEPATACAGIDAREIREMGFCLFRPREAREIPEGNRRLDIFVRNVRRLRNLSVDLSAASSDNTVHESPQRNATDT